MEPYEPLDGAVPISHFDFYRFDDPQEWEDAGFRDVFAEPGLKLVEWPEKAAALLPLPTCACTIDAETTAMRRVTTVRRVDAARR